MPKKSVPKGRLNLRACFKDGARLCRRPAAAGETRRNAGKFRGAAAGRGRNSRAPAFFKHVLKFGLTPKCPNSRAGWKPAIQQVGKPALPVRSETQSWRIARFEQELDHLLPSPEERVGGRIEEREFGCGFADPCFFRANPWLKRSADHGTNAGPSAWIVWWISCLIFDPSAASI
jgi:hypothetical protein